MTDVFIQGVNNTNKYPPVLQQDKLPFPKIKNLLKDKN